MSHSVDSITMSLARENTPSVFVLLKLTVWELPRNDDDLTLLRIRGKKVIISESDWSGKSCKALYDFTKALSKMNAVELIVEVNVRTPSCLSCIPTYLHQKQNPTMVHISRY